MAAAAPYYVDVVRIQAQRAGVSLDQGGFRIHTALDPALQASAVASLTEGIAEVEAREGYRHPTTVGNGRDSEYLQGLVVAIDPATGDVRALVGSEQRVCAVTDGVNAGIWVAEDGVRLFGGAPS